MLLWRTSKGDSNSLVSFIHITSNFVDYELNYKFISCIKRNCAFAKATKLWWNKESSDKRTVILRPIIKKIKNNFGCYSKLKEICTSCPLKI